MEIKFDIYEVHKDGGSEHIVPKNKIAKMFTQKEIIKMCGAGGEEIIKGDWKFWAEEAMNYKTGMSIK